MSSGAEIGGTIAQAGAATFDTAVNWIMFGQQIQQNATQAQKAEDLAMILRGDTLAQNATQNKIAQGSLNVSRGGLALSQDQFKFTKDMTEKASETANFDAQVKRINDTTAKNANFGEYMRKLLGGQ